VTAEQVEPARLVRKSACTDPRRAGTFPSPFVAAGMMRERMDFGRAGPSAQERPDSMEPRDALLGRLVLPILGSSESGCVFWKSICADACLSKTELPVVSDERIVLERIVLVREHGLTW
jgi:hypothetical protein